MQFEMFGLDIAQARVVVVQEPRPISAVGSTSSSSPSRSTRVDCPGLTSPGWLANFDWTKLPRPVYPLDRRDQLEPARPVREGGSHAAQIAPCLASRP